MAVCRQYQIPHSHFHGGPNEWTESDRGKAIAYEHHLKEACGRCGTRKEDWRDDDGQLLPEPQWAAVIRFCDGCEDYQRLDERIPDSLRKRGARATWIPADDWTPEDDTVMDDLESLEAAET